MLYGYIEKNIALEKENPCVAGSAAFTNLFYLHLWLDVIGESPKRACGIVEAGGLDLHFAAITAVCGAFQVSETVFFQDRRVSGIRHSRIFGGLHAFGIDAPAAEGLRQRTGGSRLWLGGDSCRQQKKNQGTTHIC